MTNFSANFNYYPSDLAVLIAPIRVEFNNTSVGGYPIDGDNFTFAVDLENNIYVPSAPLSSYLAFRIEKYVWDYGDGTYSNDANSIKKYDFSGIYEVKLKVYSNELYDETTGIFFRLVSVKTISLTISSTILAWLKSHMTEANIVALENSEALSDMYVGTSQMYERMYKEISNVSNLMDIKTVAPKFLEFFSDTLNHKRFYAKKIGYSVQEDDKNKQEFLNYDIFERIETGIATDPEINLFRQFILDTALMFKQNGSKASIENFFKLYNFIIHIKELWTDNFSGTASPNITDDFFLDSNLTNTKSKFKFDNISIVGVDNSNVKISGTFNNLLIDNYHFMSNINYPSDVVYSDDCKQKFEIHDYSPAFKEIFRKDGRSLTELDSCDGFNIGSICSSSTSATLNSGVVVEKNETWGGINKINKHKLSFKFWNAPTNYVKTLIDIIGSTPNGVDEIAENPSDLSDDYLWADWNYGITVPDGIPGVNQTSLRRPNLSVELPYVNYTATKDDSNLIQIPNFGIPTSNDIFVTIRGFIKVDVEAYYAFGLELGNPDGYGQTDEQHVALFSLKHNTKYTEETINELDDLSNITFLRDNTDVVTTLGSNGTNSITLYTKKGEYGLIELRQKQKYEKTGSYLLSPGYYAMEIKATYGSLHNKKLKLYWEAYQAVITETSAAFQNIISKKIIPTENFITFNVLDTQIEDTLGKGFITIPNSLIDGGDTLKVVYSQSVSSPNVVSGIISSDKKYKDCEIDIRVMPVGIPEFEEANNRIIPEKTLNVIFRASHSNKNLYSNIDEYYSIKFDGKRGKISLLKTEYSTEITSNIVHKLNLNPDLTIQNAQIFEKDILNESGFNLVLEDGIFYDIKVSIENNLVSVYYRKNSNYTNLVNNISNIDQINILNFDDNINPYIKILDNITLNQKNKDVETFDSNGQAINIADVYTMLDNSGYYGLTVQSSIFKINSFSITPFDKIDGNLSNDDEKYKNIKVKYLDSKSAKNINYGADIEEANTPIYNINLTTDLSSTNNIVDLGKNYIGINDNTTESLSINNLNLNNFGTRFNIVFNREYLNSRFNSISDVIESCVIPIGNFYEPYINWSEVSPSVGSYLKSSHAGYMPFISENAHVMPHTVAMSGNSKIYISEMVRDSDNNLALSTGSILSNILNSNISSVYNGVWEELCPNSADAQWNIYTNEKKITINNEVFEPIYKNKTTKTEVIGVKIVDSKVLTDIICKYCSGSILWGLYEITFPISTIEHTPHYDQTIDPNVSNPIRYFIPIGNLVEDQFTYLPSADLLKSSNININLVGAFVQKSIENLSLQTKTSLILDKLNYWENKYKSKIKCKYYLDLNTKFAFKLDSYAENPIPFDITIDACNNIQEVAIDVTENSCNSIPNVFYMPKEVISLLNIVENYSLDFKNDFDWWNPKTVWINKKFNINYPENNETTIYSGLNTPNTFYTGVDQITDIQGIDISINDKFSADIGKYIVDASWCVSSVGWDARYAITANNTENIGVFTNSEYENIGFDSASKSKMGYEKVTAIDYTMNGIIPLQTIPVSGNTSLHFADYITGEGGIGRTISPYGLYNWFFTHANRVNDTSSVQKLGWTLSELNEQFINCFKFNNIYGQLNSNNYKINNYWAFYKDCIPQKNSIIKLNEIFNSGTTENAITIGVSDAINTFYSIPTKYYYYPNWKNSVEKVFCDNYVLPSEVYYIRVNTDTNNTELVLNTQTYNDYFFKLFGNINLSLNVYADNTGYKNLQLLSMVDDYTNRNINWIPFIKDSKNIYRVGTRSIDATLKMSNESKPYEIINYRGQSSYKLLNKFDSALDMTFNGNSATNNVVGNIINSGSIDLINIVDKSSNNFSISCDVLFDPEILNKNYEKRFELILKTKNHQVDEKYGITDYYFVGIGVYNFDIALGMRSMDKSTGEIKETYLASFGNFNIKGILLDNWYTLKAEVTQDYINVYFSQKGNDPQLALHYNIDKKYEKFTERYLNGEFESLQAIVSGLKDLMITYPSNLANTVSTDYTLSNFKEDLAKTLPINGSYSGFKVYNPYTYVTNVKYSYYEPKTYKYGQTFDTTSYDSILSEIKTLYGISKDSEIKKVVQTLNYTLYILIDDQLYYKYLNYSPEKYSNPVSDFYIVEKNIFIVEKIAPVDGGVGLNTWIPGEHTIVWSLSKNTYNISKYEDFYKFVPNLGTIKIIRGSDFYIYDKTSSDTIYINVGDVITFTIEGSRTIIWGLDGILDRNDIILRVYTEGFKTEMPILIKDKTFYKDELRSYMKYSNKKLHKVIISDNKLNVIFKDI